MHPIQYNAVQNPNPSLPFPSIPSIQSIQTACHLLGSLPGLMINGKQPNKQSQVYTSLLRHVSQTSLHRAHVFNRLKRVCFGQSFEELEGSVGAEDEERVSFFASSASAPSHLTVLVEGKCVKVHKFPTYPSTRLAPSMPQLKFKPKPMKSMWVT